MVAVEVPAVVRKIPLLDVVVMRWWLLMWVLLRLVMLVMMNRDMLMMRMILHIQGLVKWGVMHNTLWPMQR